MSKQVNIANNTDIHIRLLQFKPAWTIHCLLRFKGLPYLCENTCSRESLGLNVPLLIDGNYVFAERLALEHLNMDRKTRNIHAEYPFTFDHTSHTAEHDQFLAADKLMSDHIEITILMLFKQLEGIQELERKDTVYGLNVPAKVIGKMRSYFKSFDLSSDVLSEHSYAECDIDVLLVRLDSMYRELNHILERNRGYLISISVAAPTMVTASSSIILGGQKNITKSRGGAEALLFGHMAEALSSPMTAALLSKHSSLLAFMRNILEEYFLIPLRCPKNTLRASLWEDATTTILENIFFINMNDSSLKEALLSPLCPPSPNGFQGVNPLRLGISEKNNQNYPNNQSNQYGKILSNIMSSNANLHINLTSLNPGSTNVTPNMKINNKNDSNSRNGSAEKNSNDRDGINRSNSNEKNERNERNMIPTPPPQSPGRHSSPRTVISPAHCKMISPRTLNIPSKSVYIPPNFDIYGTEKTIHELLFFRTVGPSTLLDVRTEYCSTYISIPSYFKILFPFLNDEYGNIRITKSTVSVTKTVKTVSGDYENNFKKFPDGVSIFEERISSDSAEEIIEIVGKEGKEGKEGGKGHISVVSSDIEISLLGFVFMSIVGGVFCRNILTGSS